MVLNMKKKIGLLLSFAFGAVTVLAFSSCAANGSKVHYPSPPYKAKVQWMDASIAGDVSKWDTLYSHDPSIFKDSNGRYYVYSTDVGAAAGVGVQIKKSSDLIHWKYLGHALEQVPQEALNWASPSNLWAPDIIKVGDTYRLYYAASSFGSQKSVIMLAESKSPEGPFTDKGIVLKSDTGDECNAIDPDITVDTKGNQYMVYGSFWGGIYIIRLDKATGKPAEQGFGLNIASRAISVSGAVEGPYIRYNSRTGYYYLFVSYGSLSSDYNVRVGRSKNIMGPYFDYNGNDMTDTVSDPNSIGYKLTTGYQFKTGQGWMALGHNSVLDDNGTWYYVSHARPLNNPDWPYLQVRKMEWSDDGWPLVSPELYAGEKDQTIKADAIPGKYERIQFVNDTIKLGETSTVMVFDSNETCKIGNKNATWKITGQNTLVVKYGSETESYKVIPSWDWENWCTTLSLTGKNIKGLCVWGKKIK